MQKDLREKILQTSQRLFNQKGYEHVTMREIAKELNISPGNLTYHFARKEDILHALVAQPKDLEFTEVRSIKDFEEKIRQMLDNALENRFFFISDSLDTLSPEFYETNKDNVQKEKESLMDALMQLKENHVLKGSFTSKDAEDLTSIMMMAHLSWIRGLGTKTSFITMDEEDFIAMHVRLLKPWLDQK